MWLCFAKSETDFEKEALFQESVFIVLEYHRLNISYTVTQINSQAQFQITKGPESKTIHEFFKVF